MYIVNATIIQWYHPNYNSGGYENEQTYILITFLELLICKLHVLNKHSILKLIAYKVEPHYHKICGAT